MNIVITGTSRGIGLELCRLALENKNQVWAVARKPQESKDLVALAESSGGRLRTLALDVKNEGAGAEIAAALKDAGALDLLINNAGIMKSGEKAEDFLESFHVNSVAPFLLTQALLPLLKKSAQPKVVQITSLMGSIADNSSGGYYAYRSSKTALNMINKSLTVDQPWLTSIVMHPGWVQTDMGGSGSSDL